MENMVVDMWTKDKALRFTLDYLRSKYYQGVEIKERNQFGHAYITTSKQNFHWLYKHDYFHSFVYEFPEYQKQKNHLGGLGESINQEYLERAINKKCTLLFSYRQQSNAIYTPSRQKLLAILNTVLPNEDFKEIHTTVLLKIFCNYYKLTRVQNRMNKYTANDYSGSAIVMQEKTYSFPVKILERLK